MPGIHADVVQALGAIGVNMSPPMLRDETADLEQGLALAVLEFREDRLITHPCCSFASAGAARAWLSAMARAAWPVVRGR